MGSQAPINLEGGVAKPRPDGEDEGRDLLAIIRRLSGARSQEEIMAVVSHGVRTLLHADGATFVLRDGDRCFYAEEDAVSPLWKGRRFPMSACVSGWCMANNQTVAIPDIYHDPRIPTDAYRPTFVRSLAMAPVRMDEPVGALGAYWSEPRQPRAEEVETLQAIADAAALAAAHLQPRRAEPSARRRPAEPEAPRENQAPTPEAAPDRPLRGLVDRLRHQGVRPDSLEAYAFAVVCVAVATLVRLVVKSSGVHGLVIYSTYYPAALLAMLVGGRWAAVLALALGGLAASWLIVPAHAFAPFTAADAVNLLLYAGSCALIILTIDGYKQAILRLRHEDAKHLTLAREQHHRVKNAVAVVEAIVKLSLRDEPERAKSINRRIRAGLAEIDIKAGGAASPIALRDLLADELQPYDLTRFTLDGEDQRPLTAEVRGLLTLLVHELTTNALKHGALSVPDGRVAVTWRTSPDAVSVDWRETGGPPVQPPKRRGYGSVMLRRLVEAAGGALSMEFQPAGVTAEISLPLEPARRG